MFKFAVLIASLAYASAGYAGLQTPYVAPVAAHYSSAPSVSYSTVTRSHAPVLTQGYAHSAPVVVAPVQTYSAPLTKSYSYGNNYAPALSYGLGHGYAPALAQNSYGYSAYAAPLATKTVAIAQPQLYQQNSYAAHAAPVWAPNSYNYGGDHLLGYNNYQGHYAYLAVFITSLALASAGYVGHEQSYAAPAVAVQYSPAPVVSYSSFTRSPVQSLPHGYAHAAPSHTYAAPLTKHVTYGHNYAPALSHGHGYAPALSHNSYGYSAYGGAAPLATKTVAFAQPQLYHQNTYATHAAPVLAAHGYNHGGALAYNNHHGHYAY
ncbi:cuticle protein 16.5-like [Armigeres subalbatus]|uniref:cuticle protein 16.5-like n=1 Tax=Armigeres subalbatus TaxID=124917 RepID=UPI002ED353B2